MIDARVKLQIRLHDPNLIMAVWRKETIFVSFFTFYRCTFIISKIQISIKFFVFNQ